jgi:hypothetical protein
MIGSIAVGIIFPESNGSIDVSTEDWTDFEIQQCLNKIQYLLDWWSSQNPNANVSFVLDVYYKVPTSYEPIKRAEKYLWINEVMTYLGYSYRVEDYINDIRDKIGTDWCCAIFIIDASNDEDGLFPDGTGAYTVVCNYIIIPIKTTDNLDWRVAHEMGHVFWATDEYNSLEQYSGYLNVSDVDGSGCLMETPGSWNLSGKPHGLNGTWGQVGWRDSDGDGIQDIVDTPQRVYLNPYERIGNKVNFTGIAAVIPTENKQPWLPWYKPRRNVTINRIETVEFRVDGGEWLNASITPTKVKKLMRYPDYYEYKETYAIVNYTFLTPELEPGEYFIEIKATNQWGNEGYTNQTVEIPRPHPVADFSCDPKVPWVNETVQFNASTSFSPNGNITSYQWNFGNNNITTVSTPIINHTYTKVGKYTVTLNVTDSFGWNQTSSTVTVTFRTDLNKDGTVNIMDIAIVARAFGCKPGDDRWNPIADMDTNETINIIDVAKVAKDYGKTL